MTKFSNKIAGFFGKNGIIDKKYENLCAIGCETVISEVLSAVVLLALALAYNMLIEGLVFFAAYGIIRSTAGGWHAKTKIMCNVLYTAMFATVLTVVKAAQYVNIENAYHFFAQAAICLWSVLVLITNAPITNKKVSFSDAYIKKSYRKMLFGIFAIIAVMIVMAVSGSAVCLGVNYTLTFALLINAVSVSVAKKSAKASSLAVKKDDVKLTFRDVMSYIKGRKLDKAALVCAGYMCCFMIIAGVQSTTQICRRRLYEPEVPANLADFASEIKNA